MALLSRTSLHIFLLTLAPYSPRRSTGMVGAFFALSVAARHFITVPENGTPYVVWKMKSYIRCGVYTSDETRGGLESAGVYTPLGWGGAALGRAAGKAGGIYTAGWGGSVFAGATPRQGCFGLAAGNVGVYTPDFW